MYHCIFKYAIRDKGLKWALKFMKKSHLIKLLKAYLSEFCAQAFELQLSEKPIADFLI